MGRIGNALRSAVGGFSHGFRFGYERELWRLYDEKRDLPVFQDADGNPLPIATFHTYPANRITPIIVGTVTGAACGAAGLMWGLTGKLPGNIDAK